MREKYGNIMYRRHGLWRFANENKACICIYMVEFHFFQTLFALLFFLVFQTSKSSAIAAVEGVGVMGYGGNS